MPNFINPYSKENRGRHTSNKLCLDEAKKKYSNNNYVLIDDIWNGYFNEHLYICTRHNLVFYASPQLVIGRKSTNCLECIKIKNDIILDKYCSKSYSNGFILISTKWVGINERYIFLCLQHNHINISKYSDLFYRNKMLKCCYYHNRYNSSCNDNYNDIVEKYIIYRS